MLSAQAVSERDVLRRRVVRNSRMTLDVQVNNDEENGLRTDAVTNDTSVAPSGIGRQQLRSSMLDQAGSGDIAAELEYSRSDEDDEDSAASSDGFSPKNKQYQTPNSEECNGKHSFEAVPSVNVLLPVDVLTATFENIFACPVADCHSKSSDETRHSLLVETSQYGFATEVFIKCQYCSFCTAINPPKAQEKGDMPNSTSVKKKSAKNKESELFHQYAINYGVAILTQKLGLGFRGLDAIMAFMGIAPNHRSDWKWNHLFDRIGLAEEEISDRAMHNNIQEEKRLTIQAVDDKIQVWTATTDAGNNATFEAIEAHRKALLFIDMNKIGITVSADGAWQKRSIGRGSYNSTTGHNFAVGGYSKKIVSSQCYSQHCRQCENAEKKETVVKNHHCPQNFDINMSSKSMEPVGAVQHCIDVGRSAANVYIASLVTDDDSTTRSNVKHALADVVEKNHPGSKNADGKIPGHQKRRLGWPVDENNKLLKCNGKLPIEIPQPKRLLSDPQHRVRGVGAALFDCKSNKTYKNDEGLLVDECQNGKRNFGYYLKKNQDYTDEDFESKGVCII